MARWTTWWTWVDGLACYLWRWLSIHRKNDGFKMFITKKLPEFKKRQVISLSAENTQKLKLKVQTVTKKRYLNTRFVKSLINYFGAPKGTDDIRVVYDGAKSGLTDSTSAPNCYMPLLSSLLMFVSSKSWYSDMDLGEMFLNYFIHVDLRLYCGVDVNTNPTDFSGTEHLRALEPLPI